MTKLKLLAAAAIVTSLSAAPAMAKDMSHHSDKQTMKSKKVNKQARAQRMRDNADVTYDRSYGRRAAYDRGYNDGFWPADIAANVVTGAVATAGAIASAPFRDSYAYGNTYAYDNSYTAPAPVYRSNWDNGWNNNWARRQSVQQGGFICTPGSYYTNSYGYTQLCQ